MLGGFLCGAQIVTIPDANFKNALVNEFVVDTNFDDIGDAVADTNNDGEIQLDEAEAVISLVIKDYEIASMEGIQSFTNLNNLDCSYNSIVDLDLSQNLALRFLYCHNNEIVVLNLTNNENLIHINCGLNNIESLDVSQITDLSTLRCRFNNLTELDISNNLDLRDLSCSGNSLSALDVTNNSNILFLTCSGNQIEELDLSQNVDLYWFQCHQNEALTFLDLRNGNNNGLSLMWAQDTPNLRCVLVDNKTFADNKECGYPTSGWCKDDNDIFIENVVDCVLSSKDFTSTEILLYPNPTDDILILQTGLHIEEIKVYSIKGEVIKNILKDKKSEINVSLLSPGIYLLEALVEGKRSIFRFVKK